MSSDERVEDYFTSRVEQVRKWVDASSVIPPTTRKAFLDLLTAHDAANARAERAEIRCDRLEHIIEFIRTYDPNVVDSAEAKYPAAADKKGNDDD